MFFWGDLHLNQRGVLQVKSYILFTCAGNWFFNQLFWPHLSETGCADHSHWAKAYVVLINWFYDITASLRDSDVIYSSTQLYNITTSNLWHHQLRVTTYKEKPPQQCHKSIFWLGSHHIGLYHTKWIKGLKTKSYLVYLIWFTNAFHKNSVTLAAKQSRNVKLYFWDLKNKDDNEVPSISLWMINCQVIQPRKMKYYCSEIIPFVLQKMLLKQNLMFIYTFFKLVLLIIEHNKSIELFEG